MAFLLILLFIPLSGWTQIDFCQSQKDGSLKLEADSIFHELIDSTLLDYKQSRKIEGYRIQIYFGGDRKEASKVKADFLRKYSEYEAYTLYQRPNFKIRVGNFRNKLETQKLYHELKETFNTVFIVPTEIEYPKLPQLN